MRAAGVTGAAELAREGLPPKDDARAADEMQGAETTQNKR
jgi:hypothetical protein